MQAVKKLPLSPLPTIAPVSPVIQGWDYNHDTLGGGMNLGTDLGTMHGLLTGDEVAGLGIVEAAHTAEAPEGSPRGRPGRPPAHPCAGPRAKPPRPTRRNPQGQANPEQRRQKRKKVYQQSNDTLRGYGPRAAKRAEARQPKGVKGKETGSAGRKQPPGSSHGCSS